MLLKNLISNLKPEVGALKIKGISFDSRSIKKGDLFVSIKGKKFDGNNYIGREVRSSGIFFFIAPDVGDDFEANPGGNRKYMDTVMALGVNCPDVEVDIDGEKKMVKSLPHLDTNDFLGVPVLATIGLGKPWKGTDGVERKSFEVKTIDKWEEGEKVDVELEDLPF